jgi:hypothetical protein
MRVLLVACGSPWLRAAPKPAPAAGQPAAMERALALRSLLGNQGGLTPALSDLVAAFEAEPPAAPALRASPVQLLGGHGLSRDLAGLVEAYARVPQEAASTWPELGADTVLRRYLDGAYSVPATPADAWYADAPGASSSSSSASEPREVPADFWQCELAPLQGLLCNGMDTVFPVVGHGRRLQLAWPAPTAPGIHDAFILNRGTGGSLKDGTGRTQFEAAMVEDMRFFTLFRLAGRPSAWHLSAISVHPIIRGLLPFAGAPEEAPGRCSGRATAARFTAPHGMARIGAPRGQSTEGGAAYAVVADPAVHGLALVTSDREVVQAWGAAEPCDREVVQPWGAAGAPGLVDGPREAARFNRPTFLASIWLRNGAPSSSFFVADTGNHAIRMVNGEGRVSTLAGMGEPGHLDGAAETARFREPSGVAALNGDVCYVADHGNQVIRRIHRGLVSTIAGSPGQAGDADGPGAEARFRDLQGLACHPETGELFVVDGHRVRRLAPVGEGFRVTTVLGALEPGFQPRPGEPLSPCLNHPTGLELRDRVLYLADTGNRAVRVFDLATSELWTVAGDPGAPMGVSYGLCRDNLPFQPAEGFAGLDSPRAFLPDFPAPHRQAVLTGRCITQTPLGWTRAEARDLHEDFPAGMETRERELRLAAPGEIERGATLALELDLAPREGFARTGAYSYRVAFLDAQGQPLLSPTGVATAVQTGAHAFPGPLALAESFPQPGQVLIRATVTSETGYSWGIEHPVTVR